jgi:hypothetical protein
MKHSKPVLIYLADGDGLATASGYMKMPDGSYFLSGTPANTPRTKVSVLVASGVPVYQRGEFQNLLNSNSKSQPMYHNKNMGYNQAQPNQTIKRVETPQGQLAQVRAEVPAAMGEVLTWNIILDNLLGAAPVQGILGDGWDLIALQKGLPAFPATFVIGGTFGTATIAQVNKIVKVNNVRIHKFQGEANLSDFWASSPFKIAETDLQGSVTERVIDFNLNQDGTQFDTKFRLVPDFRFIFAGENGIFFEIPAGRKVSLTVKVQSYGAAELMERVK